jgi:hypothetical protein
MTVLGVFDPTSNAFALPVPYRRAWMPKPEIILHHTGWKWRINIASPQATKSTAIATTAKSKSITLRFVAWRIELRCSLKRPINPPVTFSLPVRIISTPKLVSPEYEIYLFTPTYLLAIGEPIMKSNSKLNRVLIVGGTHGNEFTGAYLIKRF